MRLDTLLPLLLSLVQVTVLAVAFRRSPWTQIARVPARLHLIFGALAFLVLFWQIVARPVPHLPLHLLGITAVTLLLGPELAVLVGSLAQFIVLALRQEPLAQALLDACVGVTVPMLVTMAVLRLAVRWGPRNLYVYLLGVGFLGGGLSMCAYSLTQLGLLWLAQDWHSLQQWSPALMLLVMFPEGFVNGALVTGLAVYYPDWMKTFDDRHFLPNDLPEQRPTHQPKD